MIDVPKKSPAIEEAIEKKLVARLAGRHVDIGRVTIEHVDLTPTVLRAIESKLAKEQELSQREFELKIAGKDAEILKTHATGESEATKIRAEGVSQAIQTRANGQAKAQEAISKTLTPEYLRYKAFDSSNAKFCFIPMGKDGLPVLIAPGRQQTDGRQK